MLFFHVFVKEPRSTESAHLPTPNAEYRVSYRATENNMGNPYQMHKMRGTPAGGGEQQNGTMRHPKLTTIAGTRAEFWDQDLALLTGEDMRI